MMIALFMLGCATFSMLSAQALVVNADQVSGLYVIKNGLEIVTIDLKNNGELVETSRPDHPGFRKYVGAWWVQNNVVHVAVPYKIRGKYEVQRDRWILLVWGERHMLVDAEELEAGIVSRYFREDANRLNKLGGPDKQENLFTRFAIRVPTIDAKLPRRYGRIRVPIQYQRSCVGIEIRYKVAASSG